MGDFDALIERIENARTDAATTRLEALQAQPVGEERGVRLVQDDRYTPYKSLADCDTAAIRAVRLLEDAEDHHANCSECEGEGVPELCGNCFPFFDAARVERRLVMQSLSALTASPPVVEREECELCDGHGRVWNNADPTSGQFHECECAAPSVDISDADLADRLHSYASTCIGLQPQRILKLAARRLASHTGAGSAR